MNIEGLWPMYAWIAAVALAVVAGLWSARTHRAVRASLPPEHVAGAALVGLFGWEMLVNVPGELAGFVTLSAGLAEAPEVRAQQGLIAAQAAFAIAAGFAVVGILRRRTWGAVLGIGLAASIVLSAVLAVANVIATVAESMPPDTFWAFAVSIIGLRVIPAVAAAALLLWPLVRWTGHRTEPVSAWAEPGEEATG
jgi:hypothetical protein